MSPDQIRVLSILLGFAAFIGAALAGYKFLDRSFAKTGPSAENAIAALFAGNIAEWNSLRLLNPDWNPILRGKDFSGATLAETNFRNADLTASKFRRANLEGADFSDAILHGVDFTGALLRRAVLDYAKLQEANFRGASLDEVSLQGTDMAGAMFDDAFVSTEERPAIYSGSDAILGPDELAALPPREFERFVGKLLWTLGYEVDLTFSAGAADKGVDIIARESSPLGDRRLAIQVKRMADASRMIKVDAVRALAAVRGDYPADVAMLVTNGLFSAAAIQEATQYSVRLVDGERLVELQRLQHGRERRESVTSRSPVRDISELPAILKRVFSSLSFSEDWIGLAQFGSRLRAVDPTFDSRSYGYESLSRLLAAHPSLVELRWDRSHSPPVVYVRPNRLDTD